ncbi:MAG TPA: M14 family zinc carboxypeptidase, partial [Chitinophagaceae bacterium]|nr:M14 family zinc carboxypeptidase [Chitinophagaceae bacterium]
TPYKFEILVDDVAKNLEEQNREFFANRVRSADNTQSRVAMEQVGQGLNSIIATPSAFVVQSTFGGYYSLAQMDAAMNALVATYPAIAQKILLGTTIENRQIWAIKISDNVTVDEEDEPEVLYTGLQHAREAITGSSLIFFMQYLCEKYATDSKIKDLVNNREFYIVPCVNPDGWERNRRTNPNGGGGQRKNRLKNTGADSASAGVDLNRNYGIDWGNCAGTTSSCGSGSATSETYFGTSAFSELETKAIRNLVTTHHFVASIDQHAYGPYYSLPFGRPSLHTMTPLDKKFYTAIPALMGTYNGMRAGNSPESVGYEVAGGIKDWLLMGDIGMGTKGKIYGMTGEGGAGGGTGGTYGSFWAPASQIINLSKGMCYQNLQLAYAAGSYVSLQDVDDIAATTPTGTFNFKLTRIGLANEPVTVSLLPMENIQTAGSPVVINSLINYYDTITNGISYTLPAGLTNGQRLRFAWKIETGGYTYFDTVTKFYNPTQLLFDNMEGAFTTNWLATSNLNTATGNWGFVTNTAFAGAKSMTESPNSNYTASTTRTATYRTTLDLTNATAAYLSFWVKHRAENFRDKLQVQVSTNGTTWVAVAGSTTVQEPGVLDGSTINGQPSLTGIREDWTPELFDLTSYKGTANLQLRFVFTSDGDGGSFTYEKDEGFFIDDLEVVKSSSPLIILPVRFIDFYGKVLSDKSVQVTWEAITDEQHDHFEVERSADGIHFSTIGKVLNNVPYQYVDKAPISGINFYRIKQIDKNRNSLY